MHHFFCKSVQSRLPKLLAILFLMLLSVFFNTSKAQAPVITPDITLPTGNIAARGIAYGSSTYIAVTYNGKIYKSSDGDNWSGAYTNVADNYNYVAFGNNVFVTVGNSGRIITSANGTTWTTRTSGTANSLYEVKYIGAAFYAVGANRTLLTSADGITWTTIAFNVGSASDLLLGITNGAGAFAIRAVNSNNTYIYRSATAASNSWSLINIGVFNPNFLGYLNNKFYIFTSSALIYSSSDATTWTNSTPSLTITYPNATTSTFGAPAYNYAGSGIYDGTKLVFSGTSPYHPGSQGAVFTSTDGINFTLAPLSSAVVSASQIAYLNGKYFQYGNETIISSTNGTVYKNLTGNYSSMASSGTSYVGVGTVQIGHIFSSADFTTWTDRTPAGQKQLHAVNHNGTKYLAVGTNTVMQSTTDGVSWTQIATPAYDFQTLCYGNGKYVAAGTNTSTSAAAIAYSSDGGTTWTSANTANNYYFKVKYVNNVFFALGYSNATTLGKIMQSADGITWTDITPTLAYSVYYFNDVLYFNNKYHFMGMEWIDVNTYTYDDFFSVSTATPNAPASYSNKGTITSPGGLKLGGDFGQGSFETAGGRMVGVINDITNGAAPTYDTYVIYTSDGINWTNVLAGAGINTQIFGSSVSGNTFRFLGGGDGKITVAFSGPLAVKLLEFTAAVANNNMVALSWKTASEQNSRNFILQHSIDGSNWKEISSVPAAGNSTTVQGYSYLHTTPVTGNNYYRLLQTDIDGKVTYSDFKKVKITKDILPFTVLNNPVNKKVLELQVNKAIVMYMYNMHGQLIWQKTLSTGAQSINVSNYAGGVYLLKAEGISENIIIR